VALHLPQSTGAQVKVEILLLLLTIVLIALLGIEHLLESALLAFVLGHVKDEHVREYVIFGFLAIILVSLVLIIRGAWRGHR
jgi:hypothetical protein